MHKASSNQTQTTVASVIHHHQTNHWQRNKQEIITKCPKCASPVIIGFGLGITAGLGISALTKDERPSARELYATGNMNHVDERPIATWEETRNSIAQYAAITSKKTSQ